MRRAIIVVLLVGALPSLAQEMPSLKDTLQWMQNTLDSGAGNLYINKGAGQEAEKRELKMPDAKSCDVSFAYQTGPLGKNSLGIITKPTFKMVEKFSLRDIDPTTIQSGKPVHTKVGDRPADMLGPYVIVTATTRDNAKVISDTTLFFPAPFSQEPHMSDSLTFELPYPYADRFTKAFKHAVMLCGGKPSSF